MRIAIIPIETNDYLYKSDFLKNISDDKDALGNILNFSTERFLFSSTTVGYLLSYLEQYFPDDLIYPASNLNYLIKTKPDLVGISAPYSQTFNKVSEIATAIKEILKVPVILGGQHITYLPKSLPSKVDVGVLGEGEETFRELVSLFQKDGNFNDKKLSNIPGIVFHSREQKIITEKRRPIQNLDSIPLSRKFFYESAITWIPTICSGRGSLYKTLNSVYSDSVRLHSAERMIGDFIDIMTFYPDNKFISITDELFLHDLKRLKRFAEIVIETNLTKYFRFNISAIPEQLTDEVFSILKYPLDINILNIIFSSPSVKTQKELKEPIIDQEAQRKILKKCYRYGFNTIAHFLLGAPNETKEDMAKNYWFIRQNTSKIYNNISIKARLLIPFPGTEAWSKAIIKRLLNDNLREWEILNENQLKKETPLLNNFCTNTEFVKIFEEYDGLNIKKQSNVLPIIEQNNKVKERLNVDARNRVNNFMEQVNLKLGANVPYVFSSPPKLEYNLFEKVSLSVTDKLEQIFMSHNIESIAQIKEPISKILDEFQKYNKINEVNKLVNLKEIFTLAIPDVLEQVVRNNDIKTMLQITEPVIVDLTNILSSEKIELDTILPTTFNNSKLKLNFEKKYDCIALIYTLDIVRHPHKVLKYCNKILNEHGSLIITFLNAKNIIMINQLLTLDISELFYTFNKLNPFTIVSMAKLLSNNNFIPKKIAPLIYPDKDYMSYTQFLIFNLLKNHFNKTYIIEEDITTFSYTYSCRKQSR